MKTLQFFLAFVFLLLLADTATAQSVIRDTDNDTRVETERAPDQDIIWLRTAGIDRARFTGTRLEFLNSGSSIFIGNDAGASDDLTNNENLFIGESAGTANTNGSSNVALGRLTLRDNLLGNFNVAVGGSALLRTTSSYNVGIGGAALTRNTTGERNTGIGFDALRFAVTASENTGIGSQAMRNVTSGGQNLALGNRSGFNLGAGQGNVLLGFESGFQGSGSGNVLIGYQAGYFESGSNKLFIDNSNTNSPLIGGDFASNTVTVNGQLGIGVEPTRPFDIDGIATAGQMMTIDATTISSGNDLMQLTVPSGTPSSASFIEMQQDASIVANIRADGSSLFHSMEVDGKASGAGDGNLEVEEASTGGFSRITVRDQSGSDYWDIATLANDSTASQMRFWYSNQDGNQKNILNLDGVEHKVGVNTTSPTGFLSVETESYSTSAGIDVDVNYSGNVDVRGVDASSVTNPGYGIGVQGTGGYMGLRADNPATTYTGASYGTYSISSANGGIAGTRYGVYGNATGGEGGTRYGTYGNTFQGATGVTYGAYGNASGGDEAYGTYGNTTGDGTRHGAYGKATVVTGTGYGMYGEASGGTSGARYGVRAEATGGSIGYGIYANSDAAAGNGTRYGGRLSAEGGTSGTRYGLYATSSDGSTGYGVYGFASAGSENGNRYGLRGYASGGTTGNRYGVYASAAGGANAWGGYFTGKSYMSELRVGGTAGKTGYELCVDGKAVVEEMLVQNSTSWPDYVFAPEYDLKPLAEVEAFINENKHLPNIPSALDVENQEGFLVGEMQKKTIEKVEELTLYMIDADKRIKALEQQNAELQAMVKALLEK